VTSRTVIVAGNSFFSVEKIYEEGNKKKDKKKSNIQELYFSLAHMFYLCSYILYIREKRQKSQISENSSADTKPLHRIVKVINNID